MLYDGRPDLQRSQRGIGRLYPDGPGARSANATIRQGIRARPLLEETVPPARAVRFAAQPASTRAAWARSPENGTNRPAHAAQGREGHSRASVRPADVDVPDGDGRQSRWRDLFDRTASWWYWCRRSRSSCCSTTSASRSATRWWTASCRYYGYSSRAGRGCCRWWWHRRRGHYD